MSLAALKKQNSLDSLLGAAQKESAPQEKKSYVDERLWKPVMDKVGNGYAVIRFLPAPEGEDMPWAKVWNHAFQGPTGQWYIENSLTTVNQNDPVSEYNSKLWNSGVESDKEIARKQKRKLQYYSNIYVVKTLQIVIMRARFFFIVMVRKSLTRSWRQCSLHSKMKLLSIPLTSGKVRTSS